jgi:hypothetical protein
VPDRGSLSELFYGSRERSAFVLASFFSALAGVVDGVEVLPVDLAAVVVNGEFGKAERLYYS